MKRLIITIALAIALLPALLASASGLPVSAIGPIRSGEYGMSVDVWTDRAQDDIYYPGDAVAVYFRASDDCFVTIYSIGTEGDVSIIFPEYPDDGFVYGGVTYKLPEYYSGSSLRIVGPRGVEYIHAVATREPGAFLYATHRGRWHAGASPVVGDPFIAINAIDGQLIRNRHIGATATVSYFVGGRVWYPRYACYDCHARSARFDPYDLSCSRYSISIATRHDYWWGYDYHPVRSHFAYSAPFWRFEARVHPAHRRPQYRYVDCAFGYGNYHPIRPIMRPHHKVVYRPSRISTWRSWERSYTRVRVDDTYKQRTRDPRIEYRNRDYTDSRKTGSASRGLTSSGGRSRLDIDRNGNDLDQSTGRSRIATPSGSDNRTRTRSTQQTTVTGKDDRIRTRQIETPSSGVTTTQPGSSDRTRQSNVTGTEDRSRTRQIETPSSGVTTTKPESSDRTRQSNLTGSEDRSRVRQIEPITKGLTTPSPTSGARNNSTNDAMDSRKRGTTDPGTVPPQRREVEAARGSEAPPARERSTPASRPTIDVRGRDKSTSDENRRTSSRSTESTRSSVSPSVDRGNAPSGRSRSEEAGSGNAGSSSRPAGGGRSRTR